MSAGSDATVCLTATLRAVAVLGGSVLFLTTSRRVWPVIYLSPKYNPGVGMGSSASPQAGASAPSLLTSCPLLVETGSSRRLPMHAPDLCAVPGLPGPDHPPPWCR